MRLWIQKIRKAEEAGQHQHPRWDLGAAAVTMTTHRPVREMSWGGTPRAHACVCTCVRTLCSHDPMLQQVVY